MSDLSQITRSLEGRGQGPRLEGGDLPSPLREYLHDLAGLEPESAHGGSIRVQGTITTAGAGETIIKPVGSDFDFVCFRVNGILGYNDAPSEDATVGGWNHNLYERAYVLGQNVTLKLTRLEAKGINLLPNPIRGTAGDLLRLGTILPPWGCPIDFATPHVLLRGERLELTIATVDTDTTILGGAITVGIRLEGLWIRSKGLGSRNDLLRRRAEANLPEPRGRDVEPLTDKRDQHLNPGSTGYVEMEF